jgi:hypothetical protein
MIGWKHEMKARGTWPLKMTIPGIPIGGRGGKITAPLATAKKARNPMAKKTAKKTATKTVKVWAYVKDGTILDFETTKRRAIEMRRDGETILPATATLTVDLPAKQARKK